MKLELLTQEPTSPAHANPILFVHGEWCAAWCWAEHFMPYFARQGYIVHALSLRGHGGSEGHERLRWTSIADYVSDIEWAVGQLNCRPILVGHSMGGFVLQHYLQGRDAPAAVLLASVPQQGLSWRLVCDLARQHPRHLWQALRTLSAYPLISTPELASEFFFPAAMPEDRLLAYHARLQDESVRAFVDMLCGPRPRPGLVDTPILVLAADNDRLFSAAQMYGLAHAYRADLAVVSGVGHAMMLTPGWQGAAERILSWLEEQ